MYISIECIHIHVFVLPDKSIAGKNKSPSTKPSKDKHSINTEESSKPK